MNINLLNSESCCQKFIEVIPCLCWGIIISTALLIGLYITLKYYCLPKLKYKQENIMKEKAHEREKEWHKIQQEDKEKEKVRRKKEQSLS